MNPERLIAWFQNFGGALTRALTPTQLLSLLLTFAAVVGVTVGAAYWISAPTYRVLFSDLGYGDADKIVPFSLGKELFAAANEPKRFIRVHGAGHNDPPSPEFVRALDQFLQAAAMGKRPAF